MIWCKELLGKFKINLVPLLIFVQDIDITAITQKYGKLFEEQIGPKKNVWILPPQDSD